MTDDDLEMVHAHEGPHSYCQACGEKLKHFSILVCASCLGDDCDIFLEMTQKFDGEID